MNYEIRYATNGKPYYMKKTKNGWKRVTDVEGIKNIENLTEKAECIKKGKIRQISKFSQTTGIELDKFKLPHELYITQGVPGLLRYKNNRLFVNPKKIGQGGFGGIYKYTEKSTQKTIILKISDTSFPYESKMVSKYSKALVQNCHGIRYTEYIGSHKDVDKMYYYMTMNYLNGDLFDLYKSRILKTEKQAMGIFWALFQRLRCLKKMNLYYIDMKLENVFYRCLNDKQYVIILGDLGGLTVENNKPVPVTYFPPETRIGKTRDTTVNKEKMSIWQLALVPVLLMEHNLSPVDYKLWNKFVRGSDNSTFNRRWLKRVDTNWEKGRSRNLRRLNSIIDTLFKDPVNNKIIKKCLQCKPEKRMNISQLNKWIKKVNW